MESDGQKYNRGLSGQGGADYSNAAWRAGDLERQRQQSSASKSRAGGDMYGLPILIFMGLCVWGVFKVTAFFNIPVGNEAYLGIGTAVVSFIIGIFIRNILLSIFGFAMLGLLLLFVGTLAYTIATDESEDQESKKIPAIKESMTLSAPQLRSREDAAALAKKIIAEDQANLKHTVPDDDGIPSWCKSCDRYLNHTPNIANRRQIEKNCTDVIQQCRKYGFSW